MDVASFPAIQAMFAGRPASGEQIAISLLRESERIGHTNIAWICRLLVTLGRIAAGDLASAWRAANDWLALTPWAAGQSLNYVTLADIAFFRGEPMEALRLCDRAIETEMDFFGSGVAQPCRFSILARMGDSRAAEALRKTIRTMPEPGRANSFGAWNGMVRVIEGLADLEMSQELVLFSERAERLVETGIQCFESINSVRTAAGLVAAACGNWSRSEEHHLTAIRESDAAPYRIIQATARERLSAMLMTRRWPSDRERALVFAHEAVAIYESLGMRPGSRMLLKNGV
jgi:hypothetical protein